MGMSGAANALAKTATGTTQNVLQALARAPGTQAVSGASAGAAGFNSGVLAGLPGLVVDTALNAANLVKAAYGAGGHALGLVKADAG